MKKYTEKEAECNFEKKSEAKEMEKEEEKEYGGGNNERGGGGLRIWEMQRKKYKAEGKKG